MTSDLLYFIKRLYHVTDYQNFLFILFPSTLFPVHVSLPVSLSRSLSFAGVTESSDNVKFRIPALPPLLHKYWVVRLVPTQDIQSVTLNREGVLKWIVLNYAGGTETSHRIKTNKVVCMLPAIYIYSSGGLLRTMAGELFDLRSNCSLHGPWWDQPGENLFQGKSTQWTPWTVASPRPLSFKNYKRYHGRLRITSDTTVV